MPCKHLVLVDAYGHNSTDTKYHYMLNIKEPIHPHYSRLYRMEVTGKF